MLRLAHLNKYALTKSKMMIQLLAFWHNFSVTFYHMLEDFKQWMRNKLGHAPVSYALLPDGRVLPTTVELPEFVRTHTFFYNPRNHRMTQGSLESSDARYRRLSYIAMSIQHPLVGNIDLSDWIGEIRAHPVPEIPVKQLLSLWSLIHNVYIPFSDGTQVNITKNDGENDSIRFD
jgi:hypothetical protein